MCLFQTVFLIASVYEVIHFLVHYITHPTYRSFGLLYVRGQYLYWANIGLKYSNWTHFTNVEKSRQNAYKC